MLTFSDLGASSDSIGFESFLGKAAGEIEQRRDLTAQSIRSQPAETSISKDLGQASWGGGLGMVVS